MQKRRVFMAIFFMIIITTIFVFITLSGMGSSYIHPVNGTLNFSKHDFSESRPSLKGEWEFYWNKLLTQKDFQTRQYPSKIVNVPQTWNNYTIGGKSLPGFGYATYRLRVVLGNYTKDLSLRIDTMSTSYRLFIDNKQIAENGHVGTSRDLSTPYYQPTVVTFHPPAKKFNIIVQVSNFTYARGGFWYEMNIGKPKQIDAMNDIIKYKDGILIGALLIMVLYYGSFYFILKSEGSSKYFILLCLVFILRTIIYGDSLITKIFPNIPFNFLIFLTYLDLYWIPIVIYLLIDSIFKNPLPSMLRRIFIAYATIATLFTGILPIRTYTSFITIIEILGIAIVITSLSIVVHAYIKHDKSAGLILLAIWIILLSGIHDILYQADALYNSFGELASVGIFFLMFTFSFILARTFSQALDQSQKLTLQLSTALENERNTTEELIHTEMSFLKAQIKPHFLYNSLSVIASFITENPNKAKDLLYNLVDYLRGSFHFENYKGMTPLSHELETVKAYLAIDEEIEIMVPLLTIQPIVENAVRHGILKKTEGGNISIGIKKIENDVVIEVRDDGIGISAEKQLSIMENASSTKGVGLKNINRRLTLYYKRSLEISSEEGHGTLVTIKIPIEGGALNEGYSG